MQYALVPQTQNTVRLAVSFLRIGVLWLWVSKEEKDTLRNGDSGWLYVLLLLLDDSVLRRPCHSRLCYTRRCTCLSCGATGTASPASYWKEQQCRKAAKEKVQVVQ